MWQVDAVTIVRGRLKNTILRESCLSCLSCPLILAELRVSSWRIAQSGSGCWWQYVPNVYPKIPPQLGAVGYNLNFTPLLCADLEPGGGVAPQPRLQATGEARPEQQLAGVAGGAGDQLGAQDRAQPPRPQEQRHQRGQHTVQIFRGKTAAFEF